MPQLDSSAPQNCVARALYDNVAESPDELAFKKGDVLTVLEQNTSGLEGWWLCSLRGRQGICPGNRLRLLAGVYDTGRKFDSWNSSSDDINPSTPQQDIRRSWHPQLNKTLTAHKVGDVCMYDTTSSKKGVERYDTPPQGPPVPIMSDRSSSISQSDSPPGSSSGSSGYGISGECYNRVVPNKYDVPKWPPINPINRRDSYDSYDVPRPVNCSISPSSSVSSLVTSATDSMSGSNRSSIAPDYDVPRSKPVPCLQFHLRQLQNAQSQSYDSPSRNPKLRELPLELNSAIETLERLECEITTSIGNLLSYAGPSWRERDKLEPKLMDIKLSVLRLRSSLHDLSEYSEGVLGNATAASDKGLAQKLRPLTRALNETNRTVEGCAKLIDSYEWSLEALCKGSSSTPDSNDANYSFDALDQLIVCARTLTEDVRQFASFVQGNSTLLFKRSTSECEKFDEGNNYTYLDISKKSDSGSSDKQFSVTSESENGCSVYDSDIGYTDKQILSFYAVQCTTHTSHLTHAIDSFLYTVEHNQAPKIFLAHGKFVILSAHRLVYIGDTVHRNVSCSSISERVLQLSNTLSESLEIAVHKIKKAALQFPNVIAVQEMVDSVADISHLARDLKMYIIVSSQS